MRDLDLPSPQTVAAWRLWWTDCPSFGRLPIGPVDTTLVCAMHCDGTPHDGAANRTAWFLEAARRRKERRYPELVGPRSRARLVVLAVKVGGRWSPETRSYLAQLAKAKSGQETPLPSKRAEQSLAVALGGILACATAKAVATSLLELKVAHGSDGDIPSCSEVVETIVTMVWCEKRLFVFCRLSLCQFF